MKTRKAVGLVMAKMALADGTVTEEEKGFLAPVIPQGESLDELIQQARNLTLADLVKDIELYADKFFIAMRAASMAQIDQDFDAREEALLERLLTLLDLTPSDVEVMQQSVQDMMAADPPEPDPRVEELFMQSSFAPA